MASRVEFNVDVLDQFKSMADDYIEDTVLPKIVDRAQRIVPIDSGLLQSRISSETTEYGHFVVADTDYAAFVELGTSKMAAQPFLRPAMTSGGF